MSAAHEVEQHFTISRLRVLPVDEPLPQTVQDFISEARILVHAIAFWDAILKADDETVFKLLTDDRDGPENVKPVDHGRPLAEYVAHALGLEVERLRESFPTIAAKLPKYDAISEAAGVCGESYSEVALKLGEQRWAWMHQASPRNYEKPLFDKAGNVVQEGTVTPILSKNELNTWTYCRRLAGCVANELPWFRENLKLPEPDCEKLLNLLAVEAERRIQKPSAATTTKPLTQNEVARVFGVSARTVGRWIKDGNAPFRFEKTPQGKLKIDTEDIPEPKKKDAKV